MTAYRYPARVQHGHLVIEADGKVCLIDTGSPTSFNRANLALGGRERPLCHENASGVSIEWVSRQIGFEIHGLTGMDLLCDYDIDFDVEAAGFLTLHEDCQEIADAYGLQSVAGIPILQCQQDGARTRLFFDTGAQHSYLQATRLKDAEFDRSAEDFHPEFGDFQIDLYRSSLEIFGTHRTIVAGRPPSGLGIMLELAGIDGILGVEALRWGRIMLSMRQERVGLVRAMTY
jgi:hypothetical protein